MTEYAHYTLQNLLLTTVARHPDRPSLGWVGQEAMTYRTLGERVARTRALLAEAGVAPGDRVAILSENRPEWAVAYFAVTTSGAVAVPILTEFAADAIANILEHAEARVAFASEKLREKLPKDGLKVIELETLFEAIHKDRFADAGPPSHRVEEDDLACIIYTSGTTGQSKGVMLTHKNIAFDAESSNVVGCMTEHDRLLSILPLAHTFECTLAMALPVLLGASVYYLDKLPTASVLIPAMQQVRPTAMLSVPLVIEKIYRAGVRPKLTKTPLLRMLYGFGPTRKLLNRKAAKKLMQTFGGQIRFFGIGGALLDAEVERFLREGGFPYAIGYGLTETSPVAAGTGPDNTKFRSTGPAIPGVEIKLDRPDPETGEGEVLIRGANVMNGYYKDPERTAEVLTEDGWFRTGDLAAIDEDGYIFIKGRLKNMILGPSGENIYPEEVEAVINRDPFVAESLVYQNKGKLVARVHLDYDAFQKKMAQSVADVHEAGQAYLDELRQRVNAGLSSFARLNEMIEQPEPFEKTPTQKIRRFKYVTEG